MDKCSLNATLATEAGLDLSWVHVGVKSGPISNALQATYNSALMASVSPRCPIEAVQGSKGLSTITQLMLDMISLDRKLTVELELIIPECLVPSGALVFAASLTYNTLLATLSLHEIHATSN